jgi:hypothetical protein
VALRNEPLLASLAIQLNAGPMFFGGADGLRSEHHNGREEVHVNNELTQGEESMTTIMAIRLASLVTAINVLVASGFSIAAIIRPQILVPAESVRTQASLLLAMYAAAPRIPLALFVLGAIYKQATPALLILGALAGAMQLLDAGIGLFQHDLGKWAGPLFLAVLQFFVVYLLHISVRITP